MFHFLNFFFFFILWSAEFSLDTEFWKDPLVSVNFWIFLVQQKLTGLDPEILP